MGKVIETVQTVNSAVRTTLAVVGIGVVGGGGYLAYNKLNEDSLRLSQAQEELSKANERIAAQAIEVERLHDENAKLQEDVERLETSLKLLKVDTRLATMEVVKVEPATERAAVKTTVRFVELTPNGDPIAEPRDFTVDGDQVYIDSLVVKFADEYIEKADLQRGTTLVLFQRIFGNQQSAEQGQSLDEVGRRPQAYARGGVETDFEKQIWDQFWLIANDEKKAQSLGIRAAHGQAVSVKVEPGARYRVQLRASDGLTLTPLAR
jgi:hypothetical protein